MTRRAAATAPSPRTVRVAIYARQSVASELQFGSIQAQREAVEAYVKSQRGDGWEALGEHYDDGGYSGADVERPAFQRLLADVTAGRVDVIAVYKIDRVSRSLADFVRFTQLLDQRGVGFVSITQSFDTRTSMGRLTLNILASFSQFERETISERTRDKMMATRKKGLWTGGRPPLGYDVVDKKLVVNAAEAETVREVFAVYMDAGSLIPAVQELARRGVRTKKLRTPFTKTSVHALLTNPIYCGKAKCGKEVVDGVHDAIVDAAVWNAAQAQLRVQRRPGSDAPRNNRLGALLRGILFCGKCGAAMVHHWSGREAGPIYRYYVCQTSMKQGADACTGSRAPAGELEAFVVDKVRAIGRDPQVVAEVVAAAKRQVEAREPEIAAELRRHEQDGRRSLEERKNLLAAIGSGGPATTSLVDRLREVDDAAAARTSRVGELEAELVRLRTRTIDEADLRAALADFAAVWGELFPREQARVLQLLLEEICYHAEKGTLDLTFRPSGIRDLAGGRKVTA